MCVPLCLLLPTDATLSCLLTTARLPSLLALTEGMVWTRRLLLAACLLLMSAAPETPKMEHQNMEDTLLDVETDAEGAPPEAAGTKNPASAQKLDAETDAEEAPPPRLAPDRKFWPDKAERDEVENKEGTFCRNWERVPAVPTGDTACNETLSQYEQQCHKVKDKDGNVRDFGRRSKRIGRCAVYVNILNILSVDTKANKFQADFFIRLMWSEHVSTADKEDRFTRDCKFDPFYEDNVPIKNDSKRNGVSHLLRVA